MYNNKTKKLVGSFIFVFAICFLMLSVFEISNKADHINEYQNCVKDYETSIITIEQELTQCKEIASEGLGITIRQKQLNISPTQYFYIYLAGLVKVLLAVILLILGQIMYIGNEVKPSVKKPKPKIRRTVRKKRK
jgi:hypothetical protein